MAYYNNTILFATFLLVLLSPCSFARVVEHTFTVHSIVANRLCKDQIITVVNGSSPGPTIYADEGDQLVVHVVNQSPYEITIHWHGVKQKLSCWADGAAYVTQCPIRPGNSYTYRFQLSEQEGTLWWHAHNNFHRATVYGALIIYPKFGRSYPFQKPDEEVPIILGEWWNQNVTELLDQIYNTGMGPNTSDANLINGLPGDMYSCSSYGRRRSLNIYKNKKYRGMKLPIRTKNDEPGTFKLKVTYGKTYLLRIISAIVDPSVFLKIANHNMTIVAVDASYTNPYRTDVLIINPGQTIDVLLMTNQPPASYYMTTSVFVNSNVPFHPTPGTAIIVYEDATNVVPKLPTIPNNRDSELFYNALGGLTSLVTAPFWEPVPLQVDEQLCISIGLGTRPCFNLTDPNRKCVGDYSDSPRVVGAMNNITFQLPDKLSLLEAYHNKVDGVYTLDFPNKPPLTFDYTNESYSYIIDDNPLIMPEKGTRLKKFKFNATIEIVFQCTSFVTPENHPIHIHGFNFHVLGQGFGNYDSSTDEGNLNFVNPTVHNTINVPRNGWVVIRFRADNPGLWFMHCHNEGHVAVGLAGAFIVENGPTISSTLSNPPADLPQC